MNINFTSVEVEQSAKNKIFFYCFGMVLGIVVIAGIMLYYLHSAPFSDAYDSALLFGILFVLTSFILFAVANEDTIDTFLVYFSKSYQVSFQTLNIEGIIRWNKIILNFIFSAAWAWIAVMAPQNKYDAIFVPRKLTWLNEGKCNEIVKYERNLAKMCGEMVVARKNLLEEFVVTERSLIANGQGCTYSVISQTGTKVMTQHSQKCNFELNQKVKLEPVAYELVPDNITNTMFSLQLVPFG